MPENALGLPWLEHFPVEGGPAEKTLLDKSPFVIGRGDSADLQVDSHGVSREHAAVVRDGRTTRIRDLGSTNGTFVNGQRTKEAELHDGDMLQVANVEFAFYCGKSQGRQATVTQVLALDGDDAADAESGAESGDPAASSKKITDNVRRSVRRLHETLVTGCVQARLKPIVELRQGALAGQQISDEDDPAAGIEGSPLFPAIPGRVAARLRHLRRMRGVEQAAKMPGELLIFVQVQAAEVAAGQLLDLTGMLCELLADPRRLVIALPYAAAKEAVQALAPGGRLRELGVAVAVTDLGAKDAGSALLAEIRPDFVRLAASLVRDIPGNAMNLRALQAMVRAVGESGTRVIAAGVGNSAHAPPAWRPAANLAKARCSRSENRPTARCAGPSSANRRRPWMPFTCPKPGIRSTRSRLRATPTRSVREDDNLR